jgi:hypothetical protein
VADPHPNVKRGPLFDLSPDERDYLLEWIADGKTLSDWVRTRGKELGIKRRQINHILVRFQELQEAYRLARKDGADEIAEDCVRLMDAEPERLLDEAGNHRIDPAWVARQKMRLEYRLKLLAKWDWERYGDRVKQDISGEMKNTNMVHLVDLTDEKLAAIVAAGLTSEKS